MDADRLASLHVPVTQLNTDPGFGGECHLDANMVRSALPELPLDEIDLLVIENVGNLVCPAEFRVGEDVRVMVSSVTEGEDKPLKYPLMFRTCDLVLVNKVDLLPHLDYDLDRFLVQPRPGAPGRRAHARQRAHRRGDRRLARLAAAVAARAGARLREGGRRRSGRARLDALLERRTEANRAFFAAEAERLARLCHADGRALRPRRPAGRVRELARGPLRRAPRRGRVRPSRDRRQAGAARRSASPARAATWPRRSSCSPGRTTS